jgi:hypothetical protein
MKVMGTLQGTTFCIVMNVPAEAGQHFGKGNRERCLLEEGILTDKKDNCLSTSEMLVHECSDPHPGASSESNGL